MAGKKNLLLVSAGLQLSWIACQVSSKIWKIVEENHLPRSAFFWIFTTEFATFGYDINFANSVEYWKLYTFQILNDSKLENITVNASYTSLMQAMLVTGKSVCGSTHTLLRGFLRIVGFDAYYYGYSIGTGGHAEVGINISQIYPTPRDFTESRFHVGLPTKSDSNE